MPTVRRYPSLLNFADRAIYLIAGSTLSYPVLDSVDRYSLRTGKWSNSIPPLNAPRFGHASLVVGNAFIYVFCGSGSTQQPVEPIERLNCLQRQDAWEVLEVSPGSSPGDGQMLWRERPIVTELDNGDFLVFGGNNVWASQGQLSDILTLRVVLNEDQQSSSVQVSRQE